MKLYDNWKDILKNAWSIRFMLAAGVFTAIEAALPFFRNDIPRSLFAVLSGVSVGAAFVSRLVAQRNV